MRVTFWRRVAALAAIFCGVAQFSFADDGVSVSLADDSLVQPISLLGSTQKENGVKGGKGDSSCGCEASAKGDSCSCYLFGPDEAFSLFPGNDCRAIEIGGWMSAGYHNRVTPLSTVRGQGASFNDVPDALNIHQLWLYAEKAIDPDACGGWDWGFRTDIMYGTDAQKTQAFGGNGWDNGWDHGVYGWAMPQAYVEFGREDLSIKAGHFYTIVGYEVVPATGNFFYSHAYTMFNTEPFTHTGVLATYNYSDNMTVYAGWTAGWDTGFEQVQDGSSIIGGFSYAVSDDVTFTYIATGGNIGLRGDDAYSHSIVVDMALTDRVNYVFQSDLLRVGSTGEDDIGINQYLFYTMNDCWAFGTRVEWWRNEGVSFNEATFGLNYRPHANIVLRPEVRHDWSPANAFEQTTFGVDMVLTY